MLANDIKKGMRVKLRNGWYGTMADNGKGSTRMVTVEGIYTETGSVYTHDIARVRVDADADRWEFVELSDRQRKQATAIRAMGF